MMKIYVDIHPIICKGMPLRTEQEYGRGVHSLESQDVFSDVV